jgi:hypothetical protein
MARINVPRYIHEGGVLDRDTDTPLTDYRSYRASLWKFVEWNRVAWILVPALVLFVTNPSNRILPCYWSYYSSDWITGDWIGRPGVTNYGLFSLEATVEGVGISALLTRSDLVCPFYARDIGSFCGSLADSMCHRKPFFLWEYPPWQQYFKKQRLLGKKEFLDASADFISALAVDRVHVIHRFLCAILVGSAAWNFCCPRFPPLRYVLFGSSNRNSLLLPITVANDLLTSVLFRSKAGIMSSLVRDLVYQNTFVYPTLVELNRIVPKLRTTSWMVRPTGNETADYVVAVVLLVLVLGGGSNLLASRIVGGSSSSRTVVGFSSVAAVGLGYLIRLAGRSSSFGGIRIATFRTQDISYVHAFWSNLAWFFVAHPHDWYPRLVVWLVAGFAGSIYAEFHLEHVDVFVFRNLLGFFGLV